MTHTPELLRVIEQNERDKDARCVRLVDSNGVFALVIDEKYGERIAALWNMAERLGLSTEGIARMEHVFKAAPHLFITLQNVRNELSTYPHCPFCGTVHGEGHKEDCIGYEVDEAIQKARGEE